jgi:hypothetical protein
MNEYCRVNTQLFLVEEFQSVNVERMREVEIMMIHHNNCYCQDEPMNANVTSGIFP